MPEQIDDGIYRKQYTYSVSKNGAVTHPKLNIAISGSPQGMTPGQLKKWLESRQHNGSEVTVNIPAPDETLPPPPGIPLTPAPTPVE